MKKIIFDDLYRYTGQKNIFLLIRYVLFTPGFRYIYLFRKFGTTKNILLKLVYHFFLRRTMLRTSIQIPPQTNIAAGFRIIHFGNIVINPNAIIGKNFNISNGAVIGSSEGKNSGTPIIGNNVYISANAVIIGGINIGNDVLIAPNAFVNIDVPDGAIAIGNPCKIIRKEKSSSRYIVYKV